MGGDSVLKFSSAVWIFYKLLFAIFVKHGWSQMVDVTHFGPEGYFDGNSYAILKNTLDIRHMTSLDFRTCSSHGLLFHQAGARGDSLQLELIDNGRLRLQWRASGLSGDSVEVGKNLNNNEWHLVVINYALGAVTLTVDRKDTVVANATYNSELLQLDLRSPNPEVIIGQGFEGCLLQGASMEFNDPSVTSVGVNWTHCPIPNRGHCDGYQVDYCFSQPCHKHGTCLSLPNGYHCKCTTRYTGKNCEIDTGPLCEREEFNRCLSGGICQEDRTGNITTCACPPKFTGQFCEDLIDSRLCHQNPCQNNATCRVNSFGDGYECACNAGFAGANCEININECSSSPCEHGGVCIDRIDSYSCNCDGTGYRGRHCQLNINECAEENPCFNGGKCFDSYASYFCECTPGFAGRNCEKEANECASHPCKNGATCVKQLSRYECICPVGFQGRDCEVNVDDCEGVVCPKFSHCVDEINSFSCKCDVGFTGTSPNCTEINECSTNPCHNGATCEDQIGQFKCICPVGYSGETCAENIDECFNQPCLNGGTCIDGIGFYTCVCPVGLLGPNCSRDIDECLSMPCLHDSQCEDKIGGYVCHCANGWSGYNCEFDVDECDPSPCLQGSRCEDKIGDYECHCVRPWSGKNCDINLDPCSNGGGCLNNATCLNLTEGNFTCQCKMGFSGPFCEVDNNECEAEPCINGGTCVDHPGNFSCHCPPMYGGRTCADLYDDCVSNPCHNSGSCHSNPPFHNSTCSCPEGFAGDRCEFNIDECDGIVCPLNQVCVDLVNNYRCECPTGFEGPTCEINVDDCAARPCENGGSCVDKAGNFSCKCRQGFTGHRCERDVDECTVNRTSPCHRGICINQSGSFQCYCSQGYTGPLCDHEYDECLSRPCKNGGICRDLVANYKCICPIGYTGRNCETEIDECAVAPCQNNATCTDQIGSFNCNCLSGFTGIVCEEDIDECLSSPCLHGSKCVDKVNGFVCDCEDTGFTGEFCQENIDDCLSNPCVHDSNCTDHIKNYSCSCYYGFVGKNCESDVAECDERPCVNGGTCIEKSNRTIYELPDFHRPTGFPLGPYEYSTAGGYLCICPRGFTGENCEINIDDCVGNPCRSGVCVDGVDAYHCRCHQGFEGRHCEIEIDECRRYRPCATGSACIDLIGDYRCSCPVGIGGKNCTVPLTGCELNDCLNGATCVPYLIGEDKHMRNCSCATGFYGSTCEHSTAVSFDGSQKVTIIGNASKDYFLSFRFRTTLPNGLLVFGYGQTRYFLVYLLQANIHLYVENVEGDKIITKRKVNDGSWWTVRLSVIEAGLQMKLTSDNSSEEVVVNRTIGFRPTFTGSVMGGVDSWMISLSAQFKLQGFIGCMEDLMLSGELIVPGSEFKKTSAEVTAVSSVAPNCIRTEQCLPTTCNRGGVCVDLWNNYSCDCFRPHYGLHCEKEFESVTFGHENATDSRVEVGIPRNVRQSLMNDTTVSLFLRTRKANGLIFYLGNGNSLDGASDDDTFLAAELESGLLRVSVKINGTPESLIDKLGQRLDDAYYHFLRVSLIDRTLSASINDTMLFRMGVEANRDKHLVATKLYLGGLPLQATSRRHKRQTSFSVTQHPLTNIPQTMEIVPTLTTSPAQEFSHFKGILQDVRVNNWLVEMFNSSGDSSVRVLRDNVTIWNVLPGVQSDDACRPNPCGNGSNCTVTWNDYICECAEGFRGKNCTDKEFCAFFSCPEGSECRSLIDGYECISNATFNGVNSSVTLVPRISSSSNDSIPSTFSFYFRSQIGGSILHLSNGIDAFLDVSMPNASVLLLSWGNARGEQGEEYEIIYPTAVDGGWHFVSIAFRDRFTFVELDDNGKTSRLPSSPTWSFRQILNQNSTSVIVGQKYRGCLRELRLGSIHLPFLPRISLLNDTSSNYFEAMNLDYIEPNTCQLCYDQECSRQSVCFDRFNNYHCNCSEGFTGQFCEIDIDECDGVTCANGGTCVDGVAKFHCECQPGYEGIRCEFDIDECSSDPCQNGGTCNDMIASYNCVCSSNYTGVNCEKEKAFDCSAHPCHGGATCLNVTAERSGDVAYRCVCPIGLTGVICEAEIDFCLPGPCANGATCVNRPQFGMFECICPKNYEGPKCNEKINHCKSVPCHNGGTCQPTQDSFTCSCPTTHKGHQCDEDVDECEDGSVCLYNGTCINRQSGYDCVCVEDRFGPNCTYYNACAAQPWCANGECIPLDLEETTYIPNCTCDEGYEGRFCDEEIQILDAQTLGIVVGSVVAATILIIVVALVVFLTMAKKKRATRGTYSPSRQEMFGSRVEMGNVMKPPPEERLI